MSRASLLVASAAALISACVASERAPSSEQNRSAEICGLPSIDAPATRPIDPCRDGTLVFGPQRIARTRGCPDEESFVFDTTAEAHACVRLDSGGGDGKHRVPSGSIEIDGHRVIGPEAFNQNVLGIERRLSLAAGEHELSARLRGPPGTWADVSVLTGGDEARHGLVQSDHLELFDLFADPATFHGDADPTHLTASGTVRHLWGLPSRQADWLVRWRFEIMRVDSCALVRTLPGESPITGSADFAPDATWDGRDDGGADAPSGDYGYRLVADLVRRHHSEERVIDTLATALQTVSLQRVEGFVDFHTHPMSYLGFGAKALYGAPDAGLLMPSGTLACNGSDTRAADEADALGNCNSAHGGWGLDNGCGDYIRAAIINAAVDSDFAFKTSNVHGDHEHAGYPDFQFWPHQTSILHQQMWWEWLKRAHDGGLSVIVALTVNNELLAEILNGNKPYDDRGTAETQIAETVRMVGQHSDFMEIAYSSADLERIVGQKKLAVVLGMEVDRIGNWNTTALPSEDDIRGEIRHLHDLGVRYVFPVHLVDNVFGGAAVYSLMFSFANKRANGYHFLVETSSDPDITYALGRIDGVPLFGIGNASLVAIHGLLVGLGELPAPCINDISCLPPPGKVRCCGNFGSITDILSPSPELDVYSFIPPGHVNVLGLSGRGEIAIDELMKLGTIIDLDHMSEKSMERVIEIAESKKDVTGGAGYPLMFGHSGIRGADSSERIPPRRLVQRVAALGGMMGAGTAHKDPDEFIASYRDSTSVMGAGQVGLGTDVDGFERLPMNAHDCVLGADTAGSDAFYTRFLAESGIGTKATNGNRTWDYVLDCGMSHYGLMPEWLFDVKAFHDGGDVTDDLMQTAKGFVRMWKQAEDVSGSL